MAGIEFGMPCTRRGQCWGIVMLCGIKRPLMSRRKWQGRSLSPLDVALSAGITSGLSQSCTPKDYALRDHLWDELEDVAGLEVWLFIPFRQGFFR